MRSGRAVATACVLIGSARVAGITAWILFMYWVGFSSAMTAHL
jgi:hypothetical protein